MKKLWVLAVLCGLLPAVKAADVAGTEVGITADVTFVTKYIWRGYDVLDDKAAWQPSVNLDLGGGFDFNVWASYPGAGGQTMHGADLSRVDKTQYNYTLSYSNSLFEDCYKTDYKVGWRYYDYISMPSDAIDLQEGFIEVSMPQLIGNGLVPHAAYYQMWKAKHTDGPIITYNGDTMPAITGGAILLAGFDYNFTLPETTDLPMIFSWDIVYNDGVGTENVDHDWSHMLWGLKTNFKCPMTGATITPAVYFQNSFESTVNDEDELFAGLSYTLNF